MNSTFYISKLLIESYFEKNALSDDVLTIHIHDCGTVQHGLSLLNNLCDGFSRIFYKAKG